MASVKSHFIREKKFSVVNQGFRSGRKGKGHHSSGTLSDDHTLFLLHQQRDKLEKRGGKSRWWRFGL